ncbi:MAG: GNAT family N-acetyltransferase [Planctomycetes bacterium]|nr:GNAT family N-acetyltransferase [Planctomycetota bacterium]
MKFELIRPRDLDTCLMKSWHQIQYEDPMLRHPFLSPGFTQAVAAVRDDVEIAVLETDGEVVGFFPFQRSRANAGQPAGGPLSNAHGVVLRPGVAIDGRDLLRACGLKSWKFHLVMAEQVAFRPYHHVVDENFYMDLSSGFEAYEQSRLATGSQSYRTVLRKDRKLKREMDSVKFEFHTEDTAVFDQLIAWKREQCQEKKAVDTFSVEWTINLLRQILDNPTDHLRAVLSVLYINDEPSAVSCDLVADNIADTWIPAYGELHAKYSPGTVLLRERCKVYAETGIAKVYLGTPGLRWKDTFRSASDPFASGSIEAGLLSQVAKRSISQSLAWARDSPLRGPGRVAKQAVRRLLEHYTLR